MFEASKKEISVLWDMSKEISKHIVVMQTTNKVLPFLQANSRMRGRLCGVCGDYNGDTINEFRKPQNNQAHNSEEYASSYAIMDSDCSSSQSEQ
jgi:hypothetical protein